MEVQETHHAMPGIGTIRRWRREAPDGFEFALLAPREIGQESFRAGAVTESAVAALVGVAAELRATTAVFASPPELAESRANKAAVKDFLATVRPRFARVVWEPPPSWEPSSAVKIAVDAGAFPARDPLVHGLVDGPSAYYRLHGPAGHKSRYEDPAIEQLAELAGSVDDCDAYFVFTNVDMFADAKRFKKAANLS